MAIGTAMAMVLIKMIQNSFSFTDLHTHILPTVDDGAKNMQISINMLRLQKKTGTDRVMLTPHFYPTRQKLDAFLLKRERAYSELLSCWDEDTMPHLRLGVEVRYTPLLAQMDLQQLTLSDSKYLLLELPDFGPIPFLDKVIDRMLSQNITPILAHVERCDLFRDTPECLYKLIKMGAIAQIDVMALIGKSKSKFAKICLKNGLAQIVGSDMHNLTDRALTIGSVQLKEELQQLQNAEIFARAVWEDTPLPPFAVSSLRKGLFGYRLG